MSLSLPYPSIVFVPLDVLTAEELNEMAQNTNYIAAQVPATTDTSPTGVNVLRLGNRKIMWGEFSQTFAADSVTSVTVTLPEAMPDTNYAVILSRYAVDTDVSGIENINPGLRNSTRTTTNFQVAVYSNRSSALNNIGIKWLAIG